MVPCPLIYVSGWFPSPVSHFFWTQNTKDEKSIVPGIAVHCLICTLSLKIGTVLVILVEEPRSLSFCVPVFVVLKGVTPVLVSLHSPALTKIYGSVLIFSIIHFNEALRQRNLVNSEQFSSQTSENVLHITSVSFLDPRPAVFMTYDMFSSMLSDHAAKQSSILANLMFGNRNNCRIGNNLLVEKRSLQRRDLRTFGKP